MKLPALRDLPIRQKLLVIMMAITGAALILSAVGVLGADSLLFRRSLERDIEGLSSIIGENSTGAIAFEDPKTADDTLRALRARPHMIDACIYRADGTILAHYSRPGAAASCPPAQQADVIRFGSGELTSSHAILLQGRRIGTLAIAYDLGEIAERRRIYGGTVIGILLTSVLLAYILSAQLRDTIADPVLKLADTAAAVTENRDYSIRAERLSGDELGVLVDAFNAMLTGIQSRERELRTALASRGEALVDAQNARDSLETTLASITDAVISTNVDGSISLANTAAQRLLRGGERELTGKPLDQVFRMLNEFTREPAPGPVARALVEGTAAAIPAHSVLITSAGEVPVEGSAAPIRRREGPIEGAVLVFRDVSARREAEETSALLGSLIESSGDAIIVSNLQGIVMRWNKAAERIFGHSADEITGQPWSTLSLPGEADEVKQIIDRIRTGDRIENLQSLSVTKTGAVIHVAVTVSPVHDALGRVVGASAIARDITAQVQAAERLARLNADLRKTNENLARSNEDLERFAFIASHDLQEPLRMITVYSQLLVKIYPAADEKAAMFVENIVSGTQRMRELLADLLAYTDVGARIEEPVKPADLNPIIDKALENLKSSISASNASVIVDRLPPVRAHSGHLLSLFQNLIGNAIKYRSADAPRIHISVRAGGAGFMQFSVEDNGIGIEPQFHEKIFVAFKRLHGKSIPGTGIGLAICQRVVERYGGRIWVESTPGEGSKFSFTLPVATADHNEPQTAGGDPLAKSAVTTANGKRNEPDA